jgi:ribosomal protein S1
MKLKKYIWIILPVVLLLTLIFAYIFRPMTMNDIYKEPNFKGTVTEIFEDSIFVSVNKEEEEFNTSHKITVSLHVKLKDSMTHFHIGDKVSVYYNGVLQETDLPKAETVYAIILRDAAD